MTRDGHQPIPELPSLDTGVTLLEADDRIGPLQTLVVDHLLTTNSDGYWVDTHGHAQTGPLTDIAPSPRILDRIDVARGFTPQQHSEIVTTLYECTDIDPGFIVAPAVDGLYRDNSLRGDEQTDVLLQTVAKLAAMARRYDCPVLVTLAMDDAFSEPVSETAAHTVRCESTPMGPRFLGNEFETLVYPQEDGWVQTTLAFWAEVLTAREPLYAATPMEAVTYGAH